MQSAQKKDTGDLVIYTYNKNGHLVLSPIAGINLCGNDENASLQAHGVQVEETAEECLRSDAYNEQQQHRLYDKVLYTPVLLSNGGLPRAVMSAYDQVTRCNYRQAVAGIVPYLCKILTANQLDKWGFKKVFALHRPILDASGTPRMLGMEVRGGQKHLITEEYFLSTTHETRTAFVVFDPS